MFTYVDQLGGWIHLLFSLVIISFYYCFYVLHLIWFSSCNTSSCCEPLIGLEFRKKRSNSFRTIFITLFWMVWLMFIDVEILLSWIIGVLCCCFCYLLFKVLCCSMHYLYSFCLVFLFNTYFVNGLGEP